MPKRTILVGVDGSPPSERAVDVACSMAAEDDARLVFLHVLEPHAPSAGERAYARIEHAQPRRRAAPRSALGRPEGAGRPQATGTLQNVPLWMVETAQAPAEAGTQADVAQRLADTIVQRACAVAAEHGRGNVQTLIEPGRPANTIADAARRCHADAVVVGSRGLGGLGGMLLGSVSRKVARKLDCPCIVVT